MHMLDETLAVTGSVVLVRGISMSKEAGWLYTVVAGDQRPVDRTGQFNCSQSSGGRK